MNNGDLRFLRSFVGTAVEYAALRGTILSSREIDNLSNFLEAVTDDDLAEMAAMAKVRAEKGIDFKASAGVSLTKPAEIAIAPIESVSEASASVSFMEKLRIAETPKSDLRRLANSLHERTHKQEFPVGTVVYDYSLDKNGDDYDDPFIVVDYQNVLSIDGEVKLAAVLLRKYVTKKSWSFCRTSIPKKLNADNPDDEEAYLHYCSPELKELLRTSMRSVSLTNKIKLVREPCKFFVPAPINLGFGEKEEWRRWCLPGLDDSTTWKYFRRRIGVTKAQIATWRIGWDLKNRQYPYLLLPRLDWWSNCYEVTPSGVEAKMVGVSKDSYSLLWRLRPACYFW